MRVALILLFLLALASLPGALLPAVVAERGERREYIIDQTRRSARCWTGSGFFEVFAIAVVRGDLPAAVHLADRLPAAARRWSSSGSLRVDAGGHPAQPRPAAASRREQAPTATRTPVADADHRRAARLADRRCAPSRGGVAHHLGREGLSARGRQPGVPPLAARRCSVAIAVGKLVGYEGSVIVTPTAASSARPRRPRLRQLPARPAGRRHRAGAVLRRRRRLPRDVHRPRPGQRTRSTPRSAARTAGPMPEPTPG